MLNLFQHLYKKILNQVQDDIKTMKQFNNITIFISLLLSFLGFLDATYLTILHYKHAFPPCTLAHTCETVLTSQYATIGNIPIALMGSLFYVVTLALLVLFWQKMDGRKSKVEEKQSTFNFQNPLSIFQHPSSILASLKLLTLISLVISILLVYIQAFVLHAFCQYCLGSEAINTLLFTLVWRMRKN